MAQAKSLSKVEAAPMPVEAPAPVSESGALLIMIERAARDTTIDIDRMERLVNIHRDMEMRQAEKAFNAAMAEAQVELVPVAKNQSNSHTRSRYADLSAIAEAAFPIIAKHGFGQSFSTLPSDTKGYMRLGCDVTHRDGFSKHYELEVPLDVAGSQGKTNKTEIQAMGSTMTYGRRYLTCMIFNIAIKDDRDGNKFETLEVISEEQEVALRKRITGNPVHNITEFLAHFKIETLADLPASKFKTAMYQMAEREKNLASKTEAANG
jgi:hypothetical protein